MASAKKTRKTVKQILKQNRPAAGPFRHKDGDRRQRGGPGAKEVIRDKRSGREFGSLVPDPEDESRVPG